VRVPSSGNRPKCYQSSASSVVLGVCFREHDHTGLGVAIGKVVHGRSIYKTAASNPVYNVMLDVKLTLMSVFMMWEILDIPRILRRHLVNIIQHYRRSAVSWVKKV